MPSPGIYRGANRRLHRVLGTYLALRSWTMGSEAVVVSRTSLQTALNLTNLPEVRIRQFCRDNADFFPYTEIRKVDPGSKITLVVLSRSPIPSRWVRQDTAEGAASSLCKAGLITKVAEPPAESQVVTLLALAVHGLDVDL